MAYACTSGCSWTFNSSQDLRDHIKNIHEEDLVPAFDKHNRAVCMQCGVARAVGKDATDHMARCKAPSSLRCRCGFTASSYEGLRIHEQSHAKRKLSSPRAGVLKRLKSALEELESVRRDIEIAESQPSRAKEDFANMVELAETRAQVQTLREELASARALAEEKEARWKLREQELQSQVESQGAQAPFTCDSMLAKIKASAEAAFSCNGYANLYHSPHGVIKKDTVIVPPVLLLEEAFPGKSVAMLKGVGEKRSPTDEEILGGIKRAYRAASFKYHPDKCKGAPPEVFASITAQKNDLDKIFSERRRTPGRAMAAYYEACMAQLRPSRPWAKYWGHVMADDAELRSAKLGEMMGWWAEKRFAVCKDIINGSMIDIGSCAPFLSDVYLMREDDEAMPDGPVYPSLWD